MPRVAGLIYLNKKKMRIIIITICKTLIIVVSVLIGLAYLTLLERKILGSMQLRMGPQVVGI